MSLKLISTFLMVLAVGCASGHCRKAQEPKSKEAKAVLKPKPKEGQVSADDVEKVMVFKYDGSLQCGEGRAIPPEKMKEELKDIEVFSMVKKHDGQMHIQMCGSKTGEANVYEIAKSDLEKAIDLGFKEWKF